MRWRRMTTGPMLLQARALVLIVVLGLAAIGCGGSASKTNHGPEHDGGPGMTDGTGGGDARGPQLDGAGNDTPSAADSSSGDGGADAATTNDAPPITDTPSAADSN